MFMPCIQEIWHLCTIIASLAERLSLKFTKCKLIYSKYQRKAVKTTWRTNATSGKKWKIQRKRMGEMIQLCQYQTGPLGECSSLLASVHV